MRKKGFTIIEVILVLGIIGLILAGVFIAVPAIQRAQRNAQRQNDAGRVHAAVTKYLLANKELPFGIDKSDFDTDFIPKYVDESCVFDHYSPSASANNVDDYFYKNCKAGFMVPDGVSYRVGLIPGNHSSNAYWSNNEIHRMYMAAAAKCGNEEHTIRATGKPNDFFVAVKLEGGGIYCLDNQ